LHVSERGWSSRTNDHMSIVTGPVSIPLTGRSVRDWAYLIQSMVIAFGGETSPKRIGGSTRLVEAASASVKRAGRGGSTGI